MSAQLNDQGALVSSVLYGAYGSMRDGNPAVDPVGYCGQCCKLRVRSAGAVIQNDHVPLLLTRNPLPPRRVLVVGLYCQ